MDDTPINFPLCLFHFRGGSMWGTFRDGDCLWVDAVAFEMLRCGDVVAFRFGEKSIAHRVVGRARGGLITQGDANFGRDVGVLTPDRLIGKVMLRERAGIRVPVSNGGGGECRGWALRVFSRVRRGLFMLLAPTYRLVRASQVVPWVWRPRIMRVRFVGIEGSLTKFIHRGRTVACWHPQEQRWICRRPYDLILGSSRHGHEAKSCSA